MNKIVYQSVIISCLSTFALTLSGCGGSGSSSSTDIAPPVVRPTTTITANGISQDATYTASDTAVTSVTDKRVSKTGVSAALTYYDDDGSIQKIVIKTPYSSVTWDKTKGDTIDATDVAMVATDAAGASIGVVINAANPQVDWDYQTFGLWETGLDTGSGTVGAITVGSLTPGSDIPKTGSATFKGVSGGIYLNAAGTKDYITASALTAEVDFLGRTIDLKTADTTKLDSVSGTPVLDQSLNMTGTLSYQPNVNSFTGAVATTGGLTGKSTGQFYGPAAQELGGVFSLTGAGMENYAGGYGAKK
jgi:hypothetical protein